MTDCLVEIGTEELPPRALRALSQDFSRLLRQGLDEAGLAANSVEVFATPRRLALLLTDLPERQADRRIEKRGPALAAAFDADGNPSRAALGFARSCGVEVDDLERRETDKGAWLYYCASEKGRELQAMLADILAAALAALPIPKRMRWGDREDEFVRPVKWLVLMVDDRVVDAEVFGLRSGNLTRGHRFHAPGALELQHARDYRQTLLSRGMVVASFEQRRNNIRELVEQAALRLGGEARIDDALLDEVTGLVEYPVVICGEFDAAFLELPVQVLVMTMQENQRYFAVFEAEDRLLPYFVSIANIDSRKPEVIVSGNERVIRPRFADAEFFVAQDRKRGLDGMRGQLDDVVFQDRLGSLGDKARRIERLARLIAEALGADAGRVERAAALCKADLMSDMVGEFPKLQGVIGRYYAVRDGEHAEICDALEQHYWPRHAGDRLPHDSLSQCIALADRLDSLVGIFAIGEKPGGDKDPFALRRASLAVLRIIVEKQLPLDLRQLCQWAAQGFAAGLRAADAIDAVIDYVFDRQRAYYEDLGIRFDVVDAVAHDHPGELYDCDLRIRALQEFQRHEAAGALAAANKRISNILRKQAPSSGAVDPALLLEPAERELYQQLEALQPEVAGLFAGARYLEGLERLARLRPAVDRFFDDVMVMCDDAQLQDNRLALLGELLHSFRKVADLSRIQS